MGDGRWEMGVPVGAGMGEIPRLPAHRPVPPVWLSTLLIRVWEFRVYVEACCVLRR